MMESTILCDNVTKLTSGDNMQIQQLKFFDYFEVNLISDVLTFTKQLPVTRRLFLVDSLIYHKDTL